MANDDMMKVRKLSARAAFITPPRRLLRCGTLLGAIREDRRLSGGLGVAVVVGSGGSRGRWRAVELDLSG